MKNIQTEEDFKQYVQDIKSRSDFQAPYAFGVGVRRTPLNNREVTLDTWFPHTNLTENASGSYAVLHDSLKEAQVKSLWDSGHVALTQEQINTAYSKFNPFNGEGGHPNIDVLKNLQNGVKGNNYHGRDVVLSIVPEKDGDALSAEDAYLRLHLLSHRHVKPNQIGLGVFGKMNTNAWIEGFGPVMPEDVDKFRWEQMMGANQIRGITHQDKFPHLLDYVSLDPSIRIVNKYGARLGAHIGDGTTLMDSAYINFNAGTEGPNMIEGRVSQGVFVGEGSDIGGGASTMGTLSGGGKEVISIGENCLIGANGGVGISLGNNSVVEAGTYVTAKQKIRVQRVDKDSLNSKLGEFSELQSGQVVKGFELSGIPYTTFIRDSEGGEVVALVGKPNKITLNEILHS